MKEISKFLLSKFILFVFTILYIIMVSVIVDHWSTLNGKFEIMQLIVAIIFYGSVYIVILTARHSAKEKYNSLYNQYNSPNKNK